MTQNKKQPKITLAVALVKYSIISAVFFIDIAEILNLLVITKHNQTCQQI